MMLAENVAASAAESGLISSIDDLDRAIVTLAARINAASHELLVLIRRFDERGGWLRWGFDNCTDWLHWRCDLSISAAREKVRAAHALKSLPAISVAFARGELSYSKVRALTRVAEVHNEEALLDFALHTTAARVEERCRELRCGTVASTDDALRAHARRMLTLRRDPAHGRATEVAASPVVGAGVSSTCITSSTGQQAARRALAICCCSAAGTTGWFTRAAFASRRITATVGFSSGRMAARCRPAGIARRT